MDNRLGKVKKGASARDGEGELNAGRTWRWLGIAALPPKGRISAREVIATSGKPKHNSNWSCGRSVKICKKCKKFGWFSLPPREEALFSTGDLCTMRRTERRASPPGFLWRQQRDDQLTFPPKSQFSVCPKIRT